MTRRIKNWSNFQHFKDRKPPWIKLHRDILEQRDISMISDCSYRVLIGLWLLASEDSEMKGGIPSDEEIAFRLRINLTKVINALKEISGFIIYDDINMISSEYQNDALETEKEAEAEAEAKKNKKSIVEDIFDYWKVTMKSPRSKLDNKRKKIISGALKIYTVNDLKSAILGCSKTPHNMGANSNNEKYIGLHIIFKNSDQIERFMSNAKIHIKENKYANNQKFDNRGRGQRVADRLDEIAQKDIEEYGFAETLDSSLV